MSQSHWLLSFRLLLSTSALPSALATSEWYTESAAGLQLEFSCSQWMYIGCEASVDRLYGQTSLYRNVMCAFWLMRPAQEVCLVKQCVVWNCTEPWYKNVFYLLLSNNTWELMRKSFISKVKFTRKKIFKAKKKRSVSCVWWKDKRRILWRERCKFEKVNLSKRKPKLQKNTTLQPWELLTSRDTINSLL